MKARKKSWTERASQRDCQAGAIGHRKQGAFVVIAVHAGQPIIGWRCRACAGVVCPEELPAYARSGMCWECVASQP